ncbi:MAG: efflux RND transporter permease subunit [Chloroflexi bacterium]|nr:efflux RND transporter permease subunit [Chloroflexota bacterium]
MRIWDVSIRNPVFTTMLMLLLVVLGLVSYLRMPVDLFPDISFPIVAVTTVYPGAGPDQTESQVTDLIEEEMSSLTGLDIISSESGEGFSVVIMQFTMETDADKASQDVRERLNSISNRLPTDALTPVVQRFDPDSEPIMIFALADTSGQYTPAELRKLAEQDIQQPLQRIPGVAVVETAGGEVREIQVDMNMLALQGKFLAPQQISGAIQASNIDIPAGSVPDGDQDVLIRTPGDINTLEDVEDVVVSQRGAPVRIRDVATVIDGFESRNSYSRINAVSAVVINVFKQSGSNTVQVAEQVNDELAKIQSENPQIQIASVVDSSVFVQNSVDDAINDTLWGAILATIVVLIFFRNVRNTFITMIGLPVILIGTFWGMDLFGISLNMISLLALALVVGLVIDDAIVVRENIFRWISMGFSPREASSKATAEVSLPVLATSATLLAVFLPLAYATGIVGQFFRDFGLTVGIAIVISTFEALSLAPMISAYFFATQKIKSKRKKEKTEEKEEAETQDSVMIKDGIVIDDVQIEEEAGQGWMYRLYGRSLNWTLDHKRIAVVISVIIVGVSMLSFPFVNQTLFASIDEGQFTASLILPAGTRLEVTDEQAMIIEDGILANPDVESVFTTVGRLGAPEEATFLAKVKDGVETRMVMDKIRTGLSDVPGLSFQQSGGAFSFGVGGLASRDIVVEVKSDNGSSDTLGAGVDHMVNELSKIPGLIDVEHSFRTGKPEMSIEVDHERAAQYGLNSAFVGATIRTLLTGDVASTYRGEGEEADIRVRLREEDRENLENVLNYKLLSPTGQLVSLRNVATASLSTGPTTISRSNRQPTVTIGANYSGRGEGEVFVDVNELLATVQMPEGATVELGGQLAMQQESFGDLFLSLGLSIIFVYMVLASQFGSFTQPGIIMISMPLAIIGAILALLLTGNPLDMTAMIGFIMLMGLATKNSILLVDFANKERGRGATVDQAMRKAGPIRLRPILMTAISLIAGMIPVALGLGPGGDFRAPMAIGIIGGMTTSTLLTLFIVPLAYVIWVGFQDRWGLRRAAKKEDKEVQEAQQQQTQQAQPQPAQSS